MLSFELTEKYLQFGGEGRQVGGDVLEFPPGAVDDRPRAHAGRRALSIRGALSVPHASILVSTCITDTI